MEDNLPWLPFPGVNFHQEDDACRVTSPLIHEAEGLQLDDILHFDSAGLFSIAGRRGRVVKIEEKRISLNEIERRLLELDGVCEAAALPVTRGAVRGLASCWCWMRRFVSAGICRIKAQEFAATRPAAVA